MRKIFSLIAILLTLINCARVSSPEGGSKDITPPKFLGSTPEPKSVSISKDLSKITIYFDEYILLSNPSKQIIFSPPLEKNPEFQPLGLAGRKLEIKFNAPLKENTTYSINFGNSIKDFNEGNELPYFNYVFSTGNTLDSLSVQGEVSDYLGDKIGDKTVVGLYKIDGNYSDSTVIQEKPYYIGNVDKNQRFKLDYLSAGTYKLVAFDDQIPNLKFDPNKEKASFAKLPIQVSPYSGRQSYKLKLFEQNQEYAFVKASEISYGHLLFEMKGNPERVSINPLQRLNSIYTYHKPFSDSIHVLFDPAKENFKDKIESMKFVLTNNNIQDTISVLRKSPPLEDLKVQINKNRVTPSDKLHLVSNEPIENINYNNVEVFMLTKDSQKRISSQILQKNLNNPTKIDLNLTPIWDKTYGIRLLPGALQSKYIESKSDTINIRFSCVNKKSTGSLVLNLQGKPSSPIFLETYRNGELISSKYTTESRFKFQHLLPGKYTFKVKTDENLNQKWDSGNLILNTYPESVYIFGKEIEIKPLWDVTETWNLNQQFHEKVNANNSGGLDTLRTKPANKNQKDILSSGRGYFGN